MAEIITEELSSSSLAEQCQHLFSNQGRLTRAIPGFVARLQQQELSIAIATAIVNQTTLVAEAGTGTGKTFAYLVPCLISGKKIIISTATKTLQDQLFHKDLPQLVRALGLSAQVQNLKGRNNYICRYRTELYAKEGHFATPQCATDILYIREKLSQLQAGERQELPEISEDSPVWPYVTSTPDNCLGNECEFYQSCFLVKARKRALEAQVVVINHHLFFADSRLKTDGFGELLPTAEVIVFDEAHQLAEIAVNFHEKRFSTRQWRELLDDILREWPVLDLANQPLKQLSQQLDQLLDQLQMSLMTKEERSQWSAVSKQKIFMQMWEKLHTWSLELQACLTQNVTPAQSGLIRCQARLHELQSLMQLFMPKSATRVASLTNETLASACDVITPSIELQKTYICWVERFKQSLAFHATPFDIAELFSELLARLPTTYVFTSATLTMAGSFDCFVKPLGLSAAKTLSLPSPFNFKQQALLYLPRGLPDPKDARYYESLLIKALPIIEACGGRCFFLFTSHRALQHVAQLLKPTFKFPLLIQGEESKPILLARFRALGNAVLLGTATFWEGVDVKGNALMCVIIDKLPFASPVDPVVHGRIAHLQAQGLSSFDELTLPNAVLALKQGVGRLIRDCQDRGVMMIADPRLTARPYGRQIFTSLPPMPKTRDAQTVLTFIQELTKDENLISH